VYLPDLVRGESVLEGEGDTLGEGIGDGDGDAFSFPFLLPDGDLEGGEAEGEEFEAVY